MVRRQHAGLGQSLGSIKKWIPGNSSVYVHALYGFLDTESVPGVKLTHVQSTSSQPGAIQSTSEGKRDKRSLKHALSNKN